MKFFDISLPLSVVQKIVRYVPSEDKKKLSFVNQSWRELLTHEGSELFIEAQDSTDVSELRPHIEAFLPVIPQSPIKIKRLTEGFSPWANSYLVQVGDERFVLRHIRHKEGRAREVLASIFFAHSKVAPGVEYFDFSSGVVIMRYVENDPSITGKLDDEQLKLIAKKFAVIHSGPHFKKRAEIESSTLITERRETLKSYIKASPVFFLQQYALMQLDYLSSLVRQTHYCHNDVNPNNILATPDNFYFIDWECAGLNDPFLDLATVVATLRLKPPAAKSLLTHYLGHEPSSEEYLHYVRMQQIAFLRFAICFAANIKDPLSVSHVEIGSIPAFNEYQPSDGKVDKGSDLGKFYISVMLIKQAMQTVNDYQFKRQLNNKLLGSVSKPAKDFNFGELQVPYFIMGGILKYLRKDEIQTLRLVCRSWRLFVDEQIVKPKELLPEGAVEVISNSKAIATRLKSVVQSFLPWNVGVIKQLNGGLSPFCQNFLVEAYNQKYVIKILEEDSAQGWVELYAAQAASCMGIGPRMIYFNAAQKVAIYEFVANDPRWPLDKSLDRLASLGSVISALHAIKVPEKKVSKESDKFLQLKSRVKDLAETNSKFEGFSLVISLFNDLDYLLSLNSKASLCHYDMNPWNILFQTAENQFSLIDWEFARVGNPLFDVATIANFLRLNALEEAFLHIAYKKGRISALDEASYQITKAYVYLRYAICSLGLNTSYDLKTDQSILSNLPPFNQFNPFQLKIDKNTNEGRYYIALMFVKAAMNLLTDKQFISHLKTYQQGFKTDYIPSFFAHSSDRLDEQNGPGINASFKQDSYS
ncbi:phosphotransferase [Legionella sp. PATHC038]|uniref:phosphotransferase n=1 Tax=Legionella sheltonii TaxID=2992041 RepID=UPI002243E66D|nr:phosphotransferase [Legionella sp. PATHC038]MCW8400761.1 phosphotransferase [Legionella sp. PATHC038]